MVRFKMSENTVSRPPVGFLEAGREHRNCLLLLAIANQSCTIFAIDVIDGDPVRLKLKGVVIGLHGRVEVSQT